MLLAALDGKETTEIVERDDGFIEAAGGPRRRHRAGLARQAACTPAQRRGR
jgi:hypothetical protein